MQNSLNREAWFTRLFMSTWLLYVGTANLEQQWALQAQVLAAAAVLQQAALQSS